MPASVCLWHVRLRQRLQLASRGAGAPGDRRRACALQLVSPMCVSALPALALPQPASCLARFPAPAWQGPAAAALEVCHGAAARRPAGGAPRDLLVPAQHLMLRRRRPPAAGSVKATAGLQPRQGVSHGRATHALIFNRLEPTRPERVLPPWAGAAHAPPGPETISSLLYSLLRLRWSTCGLRLVVHACVCLTHRPPPLSPPTWRLVILHPSHAAARSCSGFWLFTSTLHLWACLHWLWRFRPPCSAARQPSAVKVGR